MKNITRFKILCPFFLNLVQVGSIHLRLMLNEMIWVYDELKHGKLTGASGSRQIVKTWFTSTTVTPFYPGFTRALQRVQHVYCDTFMLNVFRDGNPIIYNIYR